MSSLGMPAVSATSLMSVRNSTTIVPAITLIRLVRCGLVTSDLYFHKLR